MPDNSAISPLLQRYLDDQLTETEYAELARWLETYPADQPWAEWLQELGMQQAPAAGYDRSRWQPMIEAILRQQDAKVEGEPLLAPVRRLRPRFGRWAAAAAAVLLLAAGGYWLVIDRQPTEVARTQPALPNDIPAPTGTKTMLTLAGGRTILLDSAQNGALASEGKVRITKSGAGQLTYSGPVESSTQTVYNTLTTAKGGRTMVVLADGTRVWLDAASSLTYPTAFSGATRSVTLTGQAYFEVVHRSDQPFIVHAGGTEIKDIGTAFNINAYGDEPVAKITLVEGEAEVSRPDRRLVLRPGEQARFDGTQLSLGGGVDIGEVLAWKNGQFLFDGIGTAEIMRQVARWYDVEIRYEGDVLKKRFSGGVPRTANVSALLHMLELTKSVRFQVEGKQILVQPYQ